MASSEHPIPVDKVEIQILADNVTDVLSTTPSHIESEFAYAVRRGLRGLSARCLCCAVHGLSCLITAQRGPTRHSLLFDSGPEDYAFARNTHRLGADLGQVDAIVLSHGHFDHAGAMLMALNAIRARNGGRKVPYYAHPGMFRSRAMKMPDGTLQVMDDVPSVEDLTTEGASVLCTTEPEVLLDDMFYVSGEIPRVTPFEHGMPGQVRKTDDGSGWEPDELVRDERWLAVHVGGKGAVVFSACSHAGIVNVLKHASGIFPTVHAVVGGLHLAGANERIIPETVEALKEFGLRTIAAGHCTGWRALAALRDTFGDQVLAPSAVGKRYVF